jgi:small subunit ribosomal protein S6
LRRYETIFISHPDLSEGDIDNLTQRTTDIIRQLQGEVIQVQQWGKKRLAYQVQKQLRGHYTFLDYACLPKAVLELERILRLDDKVMKYLTVKLEDKVDVEAIQRSLEKVREVEVEEEEASSEASPAEQDTSESVGEPEDETPSGEAQGDIPRES